MTPLTTTFYTLSILYTLLLALLTLSGLNLLRLPPAFSFLARTALSFTCLIACAIYGVLASLVLRCVGYGGLSQYTVARAFKWSMWAATGVTFVVEGEGRLRPPGGPRPAVFVGNHQTELDVLVLGCVFPPYCSVTAKKALKWTPILGQFMALSKTVFIDRRNSTSARAAFSSAASVMKTEKQSVWIFPEGTRSYTAKPDMLPFKKGAFHLAVQAGVPIVPVVTANYSEVLHLQSWTFKGGSVPVKVLEPIETKGLTSADVDDLTQRTRDLMMAELIKLTEIARAQRTAPSAERAREVDERNAVRTTGSKTTGRDGMQSAIRGT